LARRADAFSNSLSGTIAKGDRDDAFRHSGVAPKSTKSIVAKPRNLLSCNASHSVENFRRVMTDCNLSQQTIRQRQRMQRREDRDVLRHALNPVPLSWRDHMQYFLRRAAWISATLLVGWLCLRG